MSDQIVLISDMTKSRGTGMSAIAEVALVLAMAGGTLLLAAGGSHALHPRRLRMTLAAHALLPSRWQPVITRGLPAVEVLIGATVTVALLTDTAIPLVFGAQALIFTAFLVYLALLRRYVPGAECGCFGHAETVGPLSLLRATCFASCSFAIAILSHVDGAVGSAIPLPILMLLVFTTAFILHGLPQFLGPPVPAPLMESAWKP